MGRSAIRFLLLVSLGLTACGSGTSDGGRTRPTAPLTAADFPASAAAAYCASVAHCCSHGVADCLAGVTAMLQTTLAGAPASDNVYDAVQARACVDAITALSDSALCATWFMSTEPTLSACSRVLDGTVPAGGECTNVAACQRGTLNGTESGGYAGCAPYGGSSTMRCRDFVPVSTLGTACIDDHMDPFAGADATVSICTPGLACLSGACAAAPASGAPCPDHVCADGVCDASGTCRTLGAAGDDCSQIPCARGLSCSADACVADPPVPWILDVGFWSTSYQCPG